MPASACAINYIIFGHRMVLWVYAAACASCMPFSHSHSDGQWHAHAHTHTRETCTWCRHEGKIYWRSIYNLLFLRYGTHFTTKRDRENENKRARNERHSIKPFKYRILAIKHASSVRWVWKVFRMHSTLFADFTTSAFSSNGGSIRKAFRSVRAHESTQTDDTRTSGIVYFAAAI